MRGRGRDDLILPLHYVHVDAFETTRRSECCDQEIYRYLRSLQWTDFRRLRVLDKSAYEVQACLETFATGIEDTLYRQIAAPAPMPSTVVSAPEPVPSPVVSAPVIVRHRPEPPAPLSPPAILRDGPDLPEMVLIPRGRFIMGTPEPEDGRYDDEGPQHAVTIAEGFYLDKYLVTMGEYRAFVAANPSYSAGVLLSQLDTRQTERYPMVYVS